MERLKVGRAADNDIILENLTVSRHHAEIVCRPDGLYEVSDIGSTVGTFVLNNGEWQQFSQATVTGDEQLSFGHQKATAGQLVAAYEDLARVTVPTTRELTPPAVDGEPPRRAAGGGNR